MSHLLHGSDVAFIVAFSNDPTIADKGTDDITSDEKVRSASRAFRQTFNVLPSERLVSYYSCSYHGKMMNQGWMYISENYLCFYSFMLGMETKIFLELKDVGDLQKEKSKRGVFADAIRVVMKDSQEVCLNHFMLLQEIAS